jgi:hypothetical protein
MMSSKSYRPSFAVTQEIGKVVGRRIVEKWQNPLQSYLESVVD